MRDWTTTLDRARESSAQIVAPDAGAQLRKLQTTIETVVKGKPEAVKLATVALLARGHVLIEDVPGGGSAGA